MPNMRSHGFARGASLEADAASTALGTLEFTLGVPNRSCEMTGVSSTAFTAN